jgi:Serpentine type 7TM GPCR chemoreceptor Srd
MDFTLQVNGIACFVVGNALNTLLLLMIVRHTTPKLRVYSRILMQFLVVDALYLAVYVAVQPV